MAFQKNLILGRSFAAQNLEVDVPVSVIVPTQKPFLIGMMVLDDKVAADAPEVIQALNFQAINHFDPAWGTQTGVMLVPPTGASHNPSAMVMDAVLYVADSTQDKQKVDDAVGYHTENLQGVVMGFIYTDVAAEVGEPWSKTASHEVLETRADPPANRYVIGAVPNKGDCFVAFETADPVQGDGYPIGNVTVSDFVFPGWFDSACTGPTHFLSTIPLQPFARRDTGYIAYYSPKDGFSQDVGTDAEHTWNVKSRADHRRVAGRRAHLIAPHA